MTVAELVSALQGMDQSLPVVVPVDCAREWYDANNADPSCNDVRVVEVQRMTRWVNAILNVTPGVPPQSVVVIS